LAVLIKRYATTYYSDVIRLKFLPDSMVQNFSLAADIQLIRKFQLSLYPKFYYRLKRARH